MTGLSTSRSARAAAPDAVMPITIGGTEGRFLVFEYLGSDGPLTVHSSVTGRAYRFDVKGERATVDPRDWTQMFRTRALRHVPRG